jgi:GT2 family glycosyltransferase
VLRLSIVIPVLGDLKPLDDTLVSILENRPANCELLVVHNAPYNDPYGLAGEVQFVKAPNGAGFVECLNLGLSASHAPVVHLLACGVEVRPGWAEAALQHFHDPEVAAVAPVLLHQDDHQRVVSAGMGYRAEGVVWRVGRGRTPDEVGEAQDELCGPAALAGFYRRSAIEAVGGLSPLPVDTLAAVELALSFRQAGYRCVAEPNCQAKVDSAAARDRVGFRHGCHSERLFWRWASAHGRFRSVAAHAALVAGECVIGLWRPFVLLQLAGRAAGAIHTVIARRRGKRCEDTDDQPLVIASPHFGVVDCRGERSLSRAA